MRDKRFNNVEMLKRNSERKFRSPYEYAEACRLLAQYRAQQYISPSTEEEILPFTSSSGTVYN